MADFAFAGVSGCLGAFLFLIAFGLMFTFMGNFLAILSGWSIFASAYPGSEDPPGKRFGWRSAKIRWVNYNQCLTFRVSPDGLHVAMNVLLKAGHRPIFIPWSELIVRAHKGWVFHHLDLSATKMRSVRLRMLRWEAAPILRAAGLAVPDKV